MIPLKDDNPTSGRPVITYLIIGLCILVFLIQLGSQSYERGKLFYSNLLYSDQMWINALFQYKHILWIDSLNINALMGSALCLFNLNDAVVINNVFKFLPPKVQLVTQDTGNFISSIFFPFCSQRGVLWSTCHFNSCILDFLGCNSPHLAHSPPSLCHILFLVSVGSLIDSTIFL